MITKHLDYMIVNFDPTSPYLPCALCSSCQSMFYGISRKENKRYLNVAESFDLGLITSTKSGIPWSYLIYSIAQLPIVVK